MDTNAQDAKMEIVSLRITWKSFCVAVICFLYCWRNVPAVFERFAGVGEVSVVTGAFFFHSWRNPRNAIVLSFVSTDLEASHKHWSWGS